MMIRRRLRREPVGVAACITPWNAPMQVNLAKAAFALAAGCTVILKPAPDTPWSATALGRLAARETDIRPGVFNVVPTSDNAVAQLLAEDPRVDLISFTGSTVVGRHLMAVAAQTVKRVFLELGGKSAWIVCDDADLDANAMMLAYQSLAQAGQGCSINTRVLVQRSVYDAMVDKLADAFARDAVWRSERSDGLHGPAHQRPPAQAGARLHRDRQGRGRPAGARVAGRPAHLPRGYYVEPTIFADVDPDSRIAQEEIFGPVVCVIPFDTDDDAVRDRQFHDLRAGRHGRERIARAGHGRSRIGSAPASSTSTAACTTAARCRSAATSRAASAARWARSVSRSTPK